MPSLHAENTKYNKVLSKAYQKHGGRIELYLGGEVFLLEPDEVIAKLNEAGIHISRKTLYNWEQWGLIPGATFRNSRRTEYPDHAWAEGFASEQLRKGVYRVNKEKVKAIRERALRVKEDPRLFSPRLGGDMITGALAVNWLLDRARAEAGQLDGDVEVVLEHTGEGWERTVSPAEEGALIIKWFKGEREETLKLARS